MTGKIIELSEYRDRINVFSDRAHAGTVLGNMLEPYKNSDATVLGILAGGVPVAIKIAELIAAKFQIEIVSKITLPWNTESGFGAIASDGTVCMNQSLIKAIGLDDEQIQSCIDKTREKINKRIQRFRKWNRIYALDNRPVILVDDGIASGFTLGVAIESLKKSGVDQLIVAVPTGHDNSLLRLIEHVDYIYCANIRSGHSFAVADAYQRWTDVSEYEVENMLES